MESSRTSLETGVVFAGRYEVLGTLGQGGMGDVYRVLDREIGEEIALKLLRPEVTADAEWVDRFRNELRLSRRITHPNICRVYHLGEDEGVYYITMEYVPGEDLKTLIGRSGPLPPEKILPLAQQVCRGLEEAHQAQVIHRDLKPHNIMVDQRGQARVLDFGIARHLGSAGMTRTGILVGTPEYMSPEQAEGSEVDARSDIYSLGTILFEMTTGKPPFEGPTPVAVAVKHQLSPPPDPRDLARETPEELAGLILRCLAKERSQRFQTAAQVLDALHRVEEELDPRGGFPEARPETAFVPPSHEEGEELFVARDRELARLGDWLEEALAGHGRVAFLTGDAGSGKTALLTAFSAKARKENPALVVARGKCDAHTGSGDPYLPFREILSLLTGDTEALRAAGALREDIPGQIGRLVSTTARSVLEHGPDLMGTLVSGTSLLGRVEATETHASWVDDLRKLVARKAATPADSTLQQSNLLEQTTRVLQDVARHRPLLLVIDDLQWADSGSINSLFHLARRVGRSRILLIGAFRPAEVALGRAGERHPLEPIINELRLDYGDLLLPLDRREDRRFLEELLDHRPNRFSQEFRETLFRHTRGHPLFTVELLRTLMERGLVIQDEEGSWTEASGIEWDTVPSRVDAAVEERVGRLPDAMRDLLRAASVEGEEFTAEVVARVQNLDSREVIRVLSAELEKRHHLVRAQGVSRVDGTRLSRYTFQHILFQRHLYGELDAVERPILHEAVGVALEDLYGDARDEIAVHLARHFQEAGAAEKAVDYFHRAGRRATRVSANEEAIAHFNRALDLVNELPEGSERTEAELTLQLAIAVPLQWARGFAAPELERATARARTLCDRVSDPGRKFAAFSQLGLFYATRPNYHLALELVESAVALAQEADDPELSIAPDFLRSWPLLNLGRLQEAVATTDRVMRSYVPERDNLTAYVYGFELGILNMVFGTWLRWFLGYPDRARNELEQALAMARELGHPHTLAFTLVGACELYWFLGEPDAVHRHTEELAPLAQERGFVYWKAHALFYQGERRVLQGQIHEGIGQLKEAIAGMRATGTETCLTRLYPRMAEACEAVGELDEAAWAIEKAAEVMELYDERYMEAELHRHRGELTQLRNGDPSESEAHLKKAIAVARDQGAKSLELRATMSLARLWQNQGAHERARRRLAEVYGWFGEGLETSDLVAAKSLLESLSREI